MVLLFVTVMMVGAAVVAPAAPGATVNATSDCAAKAATFNPAGYDSPNITIALLSPANQSELVGTVNVTLNITSANGPLNLTLFVDGMIYPDYNRTLIGTGVQNVTVNTTTLSEGLRNFTLLFENQTFTPPDRETYHLVFEVNNHGPPHVTIVSPGVDDFFTGLDNLTLNITADYPEVYLNVSVNGEITPEFNGTKVPVGLNNYTINGSRYENGENLVDVTVWTEEGLSASASRQVNFLDYVRFALLETVQYSEVSGEQEFRIKVFTPYDTVNLTVYVDGDLAPDVANITVPSGISTFTMDTTYLSEGEHNFTFIAYDPYGHSWTVELILIVNNHGSPEISFVGPSSDVVVGLAEFTVRIESTWDHVNVTVYVDDEPVPGLVGVSAAPGLFNFTIDVGNYTKWQHTVKVVVETPEGLTAETSRDFGFASLKIEEMASGIVLLAVAFSIPLIRLKRGLPVRSMLLVDGLFFVVTLGLFFVLGVNTPELIVWHLNLASIWSVGVALIFTNWLYHMVLQAQAEEES